MNNAVTTKLRAALLALLCGSLASTSFAEDRVLRALIVDGQNNHNWKSTTPIMKQMLTDSGRFAVDVATSPAKGQDMSTFRPEFDKYDVVISNYNGDGWSLAAQSDFVEYVRGGGGFVVVHAADNAFPEWPQYNQMIGLGGWGGRNERSGPYVYFQDGKPIRDESPGRGGSHGSQHEFQIVIRQRNHPVTQGMPPRWMHTQDELYDKLRGPAKNMIVLATAFSDPDTGGTGRDEPILWTVEYGDGRVFHTVLGHADYSMRCVGFITSLMRGAEWTATGKVTLPIPDDFPTPDAVNSRK